MGPRERIAEIERNPQLPDSEMERFRGYAVMGLPFHSGHILGLRRWPASSIGPEYTSIWHRDPNDRWTFYTDVPPQISCNRYFGSEVDAVHECGIDIEWTGPRSFRVATGRGEIDWHLTLDATRLSRLFTAICSNLPEGLWSQEFMLRSMGTVGGRLLRAGEMNFTGTAPNRQEFKANPLHIWTIPESAAVVSGVDLGPVGPIPEQTKLGDFWFPQRGVFAIAQSFAEKFDPVRHRDRIVKTESGIGVEQGEPAPTGV